MDGTSHKSGNMRIYPTEGHVLIEPIQEGQSPGGIIIPETVRADQQLGVIRAIGPGEQMRDGDRFDTRFFQVGDTVLSASQAVIRVRTNNQNEMLGMMRIHDIIAKVEISEIVEAQ